MRAFLSSSHALALLISLPLLAGCDNNSSSDNATQATQETVSETPNKEESALDVTSQEDTKTTDEGAENKSEDANAKADDSASQDNLKLDVEPEEPALTTLMKLDPKKVVARIEKEVITVADLIEGVKTSPPQVRNLPLSKIYVPLVKRLRDMRALISAAEKDGVSKVESVKAKIKEAVDTVKVKHFIDEKVNAKITPAYLREQFDKFMKIYKKDGKTEKEFRLMVIIVNDKNTADATIQRIKKGEKFEDLVQSVSTDDKVKETKGELGYVRFSELPKELGEKVQQAATGVIINTPIELGKDKWAVFKKMDQRNLPDPTFEEVQGDLKKVVTPQFFGEVLKDVLASTKSEIIDYKTGGKLDEKAAEEKMKADAKEAMEAMKKQQAAAQGSASDASSEGAAPDTNDSADNAQAS